MSSKVYHQKGFFQTFLTCLLIIAISFITIRYKTLFVEESATYNLFEFQASLLLATGLLLKWKYIRQITGFVILISLIGTIILIVTTSMEFLLSNIILSIALSLVVYFLLFSNSVKMYVNEAGFQ